MPKHRTLLINNILYQTILNIMNQHCQTMIVYKIPLTLTKTVWSGWATRGGNGGEQAGILVRLGRGVPCKHKLEQCAKHLWQNNTPV